MKNTFSPGCLNPFLKLSPRKTNPQSDYSFEELPENELPFRLRDDFFSFAERSFYGVLKSMMKDYFVIFTKVSLAEIFFVSQPNKNYGAYNRINRKHVDFLICDRNTLKPVFAIELDDSSHNRPDRQERDEFIDEVFEKTGLPLLHIPVQANYNTNELGVLFKRAVNYQVPIPTSTPSVYLTINEPKTESAPLCPKCGVPMVLRTTKHGANVGKEFYGCANFPKCREIKSIK